MRHSSLLSLLALGVVAVTVMAQGPEQNRTIHWREANLRSLETNELVPKAKASKNVARVAFQQFMNVPTHTAMLVHRDSASAVEPQ